MNNYQDNGDDFTDKQLNNDNYGSVTISPSNPNKVKKENNDQFEDVINFENQNKQNEFQVNALNHKDIELGNSQNFGLKNLSQLNEQEQKDIIGRQAQDLKPIPVKIIFTVVSLFVVGCTLWIIALTDALGPGITRSQMDLSFIIMGSLLLIPGIFYGIKLIQVFLSNDNSERMEILSEFPLENDDQI